MSAGTCIYYFKALSNDPKLRWASEEVKQIIITLHARGVTRPLRRGPSDRSSLAPSLPRCLSRWSWYTRWTRPTFYRTVLLMFPSPPPRRRGVADPPLREEHHAPPKIYEQVRASLGSQSDFSPFYPSVICQCFMDFLSHRKSKRKPRPTPALGRLLLPAACPDLPSSAEGPERRKTIQVCLSP